MKEMHPVTVNDFKEAVMDLVTVLDRGFRPLTVRITLAFIGVLAAWLLCSAEHGTDHDRRRSALCLARQRDHGHGKGSGRGTLRAGVQNLIVGLSPACQRARH